MWTIGKNYYTKEKGEIMYISKIDIKNYRNFQNFSLPLKSFTTIIGENNIGKSNLLDAIALVLSNDISVYRKRSLTIEDINFNTVEQFKMDIIEKDVKDIVFPEVRVDLYLEDPNLDQEAIIDGWWYDFSKKVARFSYIFSYKSPKKMEYLERMKKMVEQKNEGPDLIDYIEFPIDNYEYEIVGGTSDKKVDNYYLKMLKLDYLDALRDAKRELNSNSDKKLLYRILADRKAEQFGDIKNKIVALEKAIKEDKDVLEILKKDIGNYLEKISLETETSKNTVNFTFTSIELSEILKKIGMQYGDNAVNIERNGLGRNNLLYIAVVMAHLFEKEDYFRVVALEEPEAHLCPILQRHMANSFEKEDRGKKEQVLITTHSTHVSSYLELENTVVLYKDKQEIKYHYLLDGFDKTKAQDKKVMRYLQKWLNATNSTMFFSRKIIFVEGIAEEILIPIFYEWKYEKTLDKTNCQVINVNGVSFANFLQVVSNGYFVKCAVLTDSDASKATATRAPELKATYDSDNILVSITRNQDTLEKEIFHCNKSKKANRAFLLEVLAQVRPNKCNDTFAIEQENKKLNIEELFDCVKDYKSEFAFELSDSLTKTLAKATKPFEVPEYIIDAFKFINGEE